ncbi:MAG: hypothetical protein ACTH0C_06865 [Actinomycetaceae bacterium]
MSISRFFRRASVIAAIGVMVATPALAGTSTTTGGYATATSQSMTACDTADDGHEIEAQGRPARGVGIGTHYLRDSAGGGCASSNYALISEFRACRLMILDQCDIWRLP